MYVPLFLKHVMLSFVKWMFLKAFVAYIPPIAFRTVIMAVRV